MWKYAGVMQDNENLYLAELIIIIYNGECNTWL